MNFNPEDFENTINPYRLSKKEQIRIMKEINDDRLTNPPGDYFRLELEDTTIDIPKLEYIGIKKAGNISRLSIIDFILQKLSQSN